MADSNLIGQFARGGQEPPFWMLGIPSCIAVIAIGALLEHKHKLALGGLRDSPDMTVWTTRLIGFERLEVSSATMWTQPSVWHAILECPPSTGGTDQGINELGWFEFAFFAGGTVQDLGRGDLGNC